MFRRIRIFFLLLLLLLVGLSALLDRYYSSRWDVPFVVALYPANGDGSRTAGQYVESLSAADFAPLEKFFSHEAHEYGLSLDEPIQLTLAAPLKQLPPLPPSRNPGPLTAMMWSLHLRWWAWFTPSKPPGPTPRIRLFLLFYDPATHTVLDHSIGLSKGHLGIANLFATKDASGSNQVVMAHELLHTFGATDKYDPMTTQPLYPDGFAEPEAIPRFPQRYAELMGGRIPVSTSEARIPDSFNEVMIGPATATEIGWLKR